MEMEIPLTAHWEKVLILSLLEKASANIQHNNNEIYNVEGSSRILTTTENDYKN